MKKLFCFLVVCILSASFSSCNYKDLDKVLFVTAVIVDDGEIPDTISLYFEAFRPSSSKSEKEAQGERIIYGVKNKPLLKAVDEISKLANLHVSFAQTKMLLFTRAAAEKGLDFYINLLTHWEEFTVRTYLAIWDDDPDNFGSIELKGEKFMGIYLQTHIENAEKLTSHGRIVTVLDLKNAAQLEGKILDIPIVKPVKRGTEQLIDLPEAALIKNFKMVGTMTAEDSDDVNYMNGKIKNSFLDCENPDAKGTRVVLSSVSCKAITKLTPVNDRMKIERTLKIKALLRGSQKTFTADQETLVKIEKTVVEEGIKQIMSLYKKYYSQGIDIFNFGEYIYRRYPWFDQKDLYRKIDLKINIQFEIQGTNYKFNFNPPHKFNSK